MVMSICMVNDQVRKLNGRIRATLAPALEILVRRVVDRIRELTGAAVSQAIGVEEGVSFSLPKELAVLDG